MMLVASNGAWFVGLGAFLAGVGSLLTGLAALRAASHKEEEFHEKAETETPPKAGNDNGE